MTLPLLMSLADELDNLTTRSYLDDFGLGFYPHRHYRNPSLQLSLPEQNLEINHQRQTSTARRRTASDGNVPIVAQCSDKFGFQVHLNVQEFKSNELIVKIVDNFIVIKGKHEEREDQYGLVAREFTRRYLLPEDYDPNNQVIALLSSNGILTVKCSSSPQEQIDDMETDERIVQIQRTGETRKIVTLREDEDEI